MRENKGLSQNALAKKAGVAQSTLSYIESGKKHPQFSTLSQICKGLETSVLDLLSYKEHKSTSKIFKEQHTMNKNRDSDVPISLRDELPAVGKKELHAFEKYLYHKYSEALTK